MSLKYWEALPLFWPWQLLISESCPMTRPKKSIPGPLDGWLSFACRTLAHSTTVAFTHTVVGILCTTLLLISGSQHQHAFWNGDQIIGNKLDCSVAVLPLLPCTTHSSFGVRFSIQGSRQVLTVPLPLREISRKHGSGVGLKWPLTLHLHKGWIVFTAYFSLSLLSWHK